MALGRHLVARAHRYSAVRRSPRRARHGLPLQRHEMTVDRALTRVAFYVLLASSCRSSYSHQVTGSPYPKLQRHSPTSVFGQAHVTDHPGAPDSSERFTAAVKARNVLLTTYRELITKQGLMAMRRPAG